MQQENKVGCGGGWGRWRRGNEPRADHKDSWNPGRGICDWVYGTQLRLEQGKWQDRTTQRTQGDKTGIQFQSSRSCHGWLRSRDSEAMAHPGQKLNISRRQTHHYHWPAWMVYMILTKCSALWVKDWVWRPQWSGLRFESRKGESEKESSTGAKGSLSQFRKRRIMVEKLTILHLLFLPPTSSQ